MSSHPNAPEQSLRDSPSDNAQDAGTNSTFTPGGEIDPHLEADTSRWSLQDVVRDLRESREISHNIRHRGSLREYPSHQAIASILDGLAAALFPTHFGRAHVTDESIDFFVGDMLGRTFSTLRDQVRRGMLSSTFFANDQNPHVEEEATNIVRAFASKLPGIRGLLVSDLRAAYAGDPAANSLSEILLSYQGMKAIILDPAVERDVMVPRSFDDWVFRPTDGALGWCGGGRRKDQARTRWAASAPGSTGGSRIGTTASPTPCTD